jgi:molybdate transport system substrate-binding protein
MGGVDALKRVLSGEHFDMVALASNAIDQLVAAGKANGSVRIDFVRSGVGVAVRAGAAHPVIDTQDALRDTVLRASGIGYSTGPSGVALLALFVRWNVLDQISSRLLQASPGTPVGALVANGEVTLGFQQESELIGVAGIELLGPMPPGTEIVTIFSAAPVLGGSHSEAVNGFLDFMNSNATYEAKRRFGLRPV